MNPVVNRFQLGGFVHHIFRSRDLAAVVQPAGDMQFFPFRLAESEIPERALIGGAGGLGQQFGQLRHPGAVSTGVGTFGVNGVGQQSDEGFKQVFLGVQQPLIFDGNRRGARQRGDKGQQFRGNAGVGAAGVLGDQQHQQTDQFLLAVTQRHADQLTGTLDQRPGQRGQIIGQRTSGNQILDLGSRCLGGLNQRMGFGGGQRQRGQRIDSDRPGFTA